MEKNQKKQNIGRELTKLNLISGLGFTIIANLIVGYILGAFLDNIFTTGRVFKIIFIVLGTFSGVYNGIRYILKELEKYDKINRDDK